MHDEWGIADGHWDVDGRWTPTPDHVREQLRAAMGTPEPGPAPWFVAHGSGEPLLGQCDVHLESGEVWQGMWSLPHDLPLGYHRLVPCDGAPSSDLIVHPAACPELPRAWGAAVQIHALWSDRSWGIGDLGDLRELCTALAARGAGAVLVSPLHQPTPLVPVQPSPYYPGTRRAWNPLLLAMGAPPPPGLACRPDQLIDRDAAWTAKRAELARRFDQLTVDEVARLEPDDVAWWNARRELQGPDPEAWPSRGASLDGELQQLARFHAWMQQLVSEQLAEVRSTGIALIGDLAVGFAPDGADADAYRDVLAPGLRLGAPPDPFNDAGQDWGIPPLVPWKLRRAGYRPVIETLRAVLRGVDGLRIDHVMGLFRQYLIPVGVAPTEGAYVQFPAHDLLAIVALEAVRAGAFVIGEDLGTVEDSVRDELAARNIAGTRVLLFEPEPPATWPERCLATITTHDLPTIAAVFDGLDGSDEMRDRLDGVAPDALRPTDAIHAAHQALLAGPSRLRLLAADDLCASVKRPNLPGTNDYPSWRVRLPVPVGHLVG